MDIQRDNKKNYEKLINNIGKKKTNKDKAKAT